MTVAASGLLPAGPLDELFLHIEVVIDKGLDRLVDAGVGGEAERFGAPSLQHSWPAGNDLLDLRIGLPPDARAQAVSPPEQRTVECLAHQILFSSCKCGNRVAHRSQPPTLPFFGALRWL